MRLRKLILGEKPQNVHLRNLNIDQALQDDLPSVDNKSEHIFFPAMTVKKKAKNIVRRSALSSVPFVFIRFCVQDMKVTFIIRLHTQDSCIKRQLPNTFG